MLIAWENIKKNNYGKYNYKNNNSNNNFQSPILPPYQEPFKTWH